MTDQRKGVVGFVTDVLFGLGERTVGAVTKFTRKKSKREELEILASWDRPHMMLMDGRCAVCLQRPLEPEGICEGPPISQKARRKLRAMKK